MKKIYMILAAITLLSLSLNAQLKATKNGNVVQPYVSTKKVDIKLDGYFPAGPLRAGEVTPPYTCGFSDSELEGWSYMDANGDNSTWGISGEQARYTYNSSNAADDWLFTPGVYLVAGRIYSFALDTKAQSTTYPERLEVKLLTEISQDGINNATSVIGSTNVTYTSYNTLSNGNVTVSTTGYYYFGIHAISNQDMYYLWVDNVVIDVVSDPVHDLGITLSAPTMVNAGGTITVQATVTNTGDYAESGYTVNFTANGNVISTQIGGSLAVGASETFTIQLSTTGSDGGTTVNFGANVICADDAEASNDNATASTAVIAMPPPENVQASVNGQSATMTWEAPTITPPTVTEGFDNTGDFPTFSIGGITSTQHTGTIGDWTVYDSSGHFVYSPQNTPFENDNDPQAWMVMNPSSAGWNIDTPHSGSQFMISFCDAGDENGDNIQATNHWLISPELSGDAQTITFWERVITTQYGNETYEVWASSTDNDPSSFSRVQSFSSNATTWTQRSVTLPAGTKYFAIRHTSNDIFGLMIDDITYVAAPLEPVSYNVYLDGQLVGNVDANTFSYTFNNLADGEYECAVSAVYDGGYESAAVPATFTIHNEEITATPDIDYEVVGDNVVITATGDGTVTLTVGDQTASGDGSASITVPRQLFDYVVTAKATAQESGKLVSNEATEDITIPGKGGSGWLPMDGTYTGNEALSFIDEATQKPIVFVDQFIGETMYNQHPDKYEYVLKEEATGETSSTVPVTVYKTSSTLNGLYTLEEIENDKNLELKANVVNSTMVYDIKTDNNMFYYGLFRGEKNGNYPIIDIAHRYSMLQQSIEQTGDNVTSFFNEALNNNVLPDYDNIGDGTVKRVDMEFVEGQQNDWIDYVPVIWTFGHNTGRTDGKNNSYGSDIKRSVLGGVTPDFIRGTLSTNNDVHQNDYGTWDAPNNEKYCVYTPFMRVSGFSPEDYNANDGDQYTFEPYMFRVWCVYDQARDFTRNSDGQLIDNGVTEDMEDGTFLLQTVYVDDPTLSSIYFGKEQWVEADGRLPYTFGVPVSVANNPSVLKFIVRFYYKRSVVEGGTQPSGLRGNRDGGEEYYIAEATGDGQDITTGIFDLFMGKSVVGVTYVNAQGMKSDKPFDGVNIVITRYSDGSTSTSKIIR